MDVSFPFPVLVSDVGGTHARFVLAARPDAALAAPLEVETASHPDFESAFAAIAGRLPAKPRSMIVCAAGPVEARRVKLTNAHWQIDGGEIAAKLDLDQGLLLNDFEAQALSLPRLEKAWVRPIGPAVPPCAGPRLVLGAGTGLGMAALLEIEGRFIPLASEAGHMDLGPSTAEEREIWPAIDISARGRICVETILSGPGLVRLHAARIAVRGKKAQTSDEDPAHLIARARQEPDGEEAQTIRLFWTMMAGFGGDMALAYMATGGVSFSGGVLPRLLDFLDEAKFRARFEAKSPYGPLLERIGTKLITTETAVLAGMVAIAAQPQAYALDYAQRAWRT